VLVLEGQLDLRAVDGRRRPEVNVLPGDLGDPKVPDRLARRFDPVSGSLLAGDVLVPTTSIAAIT
jgi:hypothetical protein